MSVVPTTQVENWLRVGLQGQTRMLWTLRRCLKATLGVVGIIGGRMFLKSWLDCKYNVGQAGNRIEFCRPGKQAVERDALHYFILVMGGFGQLYSGQGTGYWFLEEVCRVIFYLRRRDIMYQITNHTLGILCYSDVVPHKLKGPNRSNETRNTAPTRLYSCMWGPWFLYVSVKISLRMMQFQT